MLHAKLLDRNRKKLLSNIKKQEKITAEVRESRKGGRREGGREGGREGVIIIILLGRVSSY